jgi:phage anti-repressor protein
MEEKAIIPIVSGKVDARALHEYLDSKKDFSTWFSKKKRAAYLEEGKDYSTRWGESTGGRRSTNYDLTIEAAENICLLQQTQRGRVLRDFLLKQNKQVKDNELLSIPKVGLIIRILNVFKFQEHQIEAEEMHKDKFILSTKTRENVHKLFYEHRNELLGIDNEQLKKDLLEAYQNGLIHTSKAKNIRGRIALLDKYDLVRNAVVDYLLGTGASTHDALTFAETVKKIAQETKLEIRIKDETTLFQTKEGAETPLLLQLSGVKGIN